jgi:cytoskeletal protein CcmA (bactofilin family)
MGQVHLLSHTALTGLLVCSAFSSQGRFDGSAVVHGHVELKHDSFTAGEIRGRSLVVQMGANLRARASIGPQPLGDPAAIPSPVSSHRPLQLSPTRRGR